jgi:hypothetical protein
MKILRLGFFVYLLVVLISLSLLEGCGGVGRASGGPSPTPTPSATPSPTPSATPSPTPVTSTKLVYSIVGSAVAGFTVQPDAKLQAISGLASAQHLDNTQLLTSPDGKWLFTVTGCPPNSCPDEGALFSQSIGSDGKLGTPTMVIPSDQKINSVAIDQSSHFVYALSQVVRVPPIDPSTGCTGISQMLTAYSLGSNGTLAPLNSQVATVTGGDCPAASGGFPETRLVGFRQDTAGNFLWLTQMEPGRGTASPSLLSIPVAANGMLGALTKTSVGQFTQTEHSAIVGGFLVTNENRFREFIAPNTVTTFRLQNGGFQFASQCPTTVPACHGVLAIAASPSGKVVYTLSGASDFTSGPEPPITVNALTLDPSTGALVPFGNSVSLPQGAIALPITIFLPPLATVSSDGSFLFVSRNGDGTITTIALDPITGAPGTAVDSAIGGLPNAIVEVSK